MDAAMIIHEIIRSVIKIICCLFFYYFLVRIFFRMGFSRAHVIILTILFPLSLIYLAFAEWPFQETKGCSNQMDIVNADFLRKNRKYAIPFIFFLAAIATPPDAVTQLAVAVPFIIIYELGILFTRSTEKEKKEN